MDRERSDEKRIITIMSQGRVTLQARVHRGRPCSVLQRESTVAALWGEWGSYASRVPRGRLASHASPLPQGNPRIMSPEGSLTVEGSDPTLHVCLSSFISCNLGGRGAPRGFYYHMRIGGYLHDSNIGRWIIFKPDHVNSDRCGRQRRAKMRLQFGNIRSISFKHIEWFCECLT